MIDLKMSWSKTELEKIKRHPKQFREAIGEAIKNSLYNAERYAKESFGKPGHLKVKTGALRRSINTTILERGARFIGTMGTNLLYGRAHELGAVIRPKSGKYLKFQIDGKWVSVPKVVIPKRPYLKPALEKMDLNEELRRQVRKRIGLE